jgi:hypothetical protein
LVTVHLAQHACNITRHGKGHPALHCAIGLAEPADGPPATLRSACEPKAVFWSRLPRGNVPCAQLLPPAISSFCTPPPFSAWPGLRWPLPLDGFLPGRPCFPNQPRCVHGGARLRSVDPLGLAIGPLLGALGSRTRSLISRVMVADIQLLGRQEHSPDSRR